MALNAYYPSRGFVSISITGRGCALNCKHCSRRYLEGMIPATTPEGLLEIARDLHARGMKGFLLSGGSGPDGTLPIRPFLPAVRKIKDETDLRVVAHVGFVDNEIAEDIAASGIDVVSVDVVGSDNTIRGILGLKRCVEDYISTLDALERVGMRVAPHIVAGLHFGRVVGEHRVIEMLRDRKIHRLVMLVLVPTAGTPMESVRPDLEGIADVITASGKIRAPRVLGCMRPRLAEIEEVAISSGYRGIVSPTARTRGKHRWVEHDTCCVLGDVE